MSASCATKRATRTATRNRCCSPLDCHRSLGSSSSLPRSRPVRLRCASAAADGRARGGEGGGTCRPRGPGRGRQPLRRIRPRRRHILLEGQWIWELAVVPGRDDLGRSFLMTATAGEVSCRRQGPGQWIRPARRWIWELAGIVFLVASLQPCPGQVRILRSASPWLVLLPQASGLPPIYPPDVGCCPLPDVSHRLPPACFPVVRLFQHWSLRVALLPYVPSLMNICMMKLVRGCVCHLH
uniref:Uncharacterized protein n=1 Tax=Oryza brachyantha TaxID=4533 RepID=J3NAQ7_ORYBR